MEYVIEHSPEERKKRVIAMFKNRPLHFRDARDMLTLVDQLADLDCCCPTHTWPAAAGGICPGGDCDGCPDCLAGRARQIIVRLGGD